MSNADTIFAVSSGSGRAGIAIIRVSGRACGEVLGGLLGSMPVARQVSYRKLNDPETGELIDKGLVLWLPGPSTATGEDMAELHVHGSAAVIDCVLAALSRLPGLRAAEAGEFSRRAFRNGKMDLVEAEGLADLLAAEGDAQRRQALFQMTGAASVVIAGWLDETSSILARLEAAIDFSDEADVAASALEGVRPRIVALSRRLEDAISASVRADAVREGVRIVILGAPNVGKSSLLNLLAAREAAIVSPIAGTTRDTIEVRLMLGGLPVLVTDTAGLRQTAGDAVERAGMERALGAARAAHVILLVTSPDVEAEGVEVPQQAHVIRIRNKLDLPAADSIHIRNDVDLGISARTGEGLESLLQGLEALVRTEYARQESPVVVRERHRAALRDSIRLLNDSLGFGPEQLELAAESVRGAAHSLARITGRVDVEDLLGRIFSEFCVGK